MHPLFCTEELLILLALQLAPRLNLWRSSLHTLNLLSRTSKCASDALRQTLHILKTKEGERDNRIEQCIQIIHSLPMPLACWRWVTDHPQDLPTTHNAAYVHITYNGRIVLIENSLLSGFSTTIRVVRATIAPSSANTGTLSVFSFTRVHVSNPPHYCYIGKQLQTRTFASIDELVYLLHILTRVGAELWPACFGSGIQDLLTRCNPAVLKNIKEEGEFPPSSHQLATKGSKLFFLGRIK